MRFKRLVEPFHNRFSGVDGSRGEMPNLSWHTSHLRHLKTNELEGLTTLMCSWLAECYWTLPGEIDVPLFWEYAERHGLGGVVGAMSLERDTVPEELGILSQKRYFSNILNHERAKRALEQVVEAARARDIGLVIFKGPALVFQGYKDPGIRMYSDIDIFTGSRREADSLVNALECRKKYSRNDLSLFERLGESDSICIDFQGFELEIRYSLPPPGEPGFDILHYWRDELMKTPESVANLLSPNPAIHLVYLIQHMAVHHLFSRFFWFLDLAVLVKENQERLDLELVNRELHRLGLANAAAIVANFCRRRIDPAFPEFNPSGSSWNIPMMERMTDTREIASGRFGLQHHGLNWFLPSLVFSLASFYLVCDPKEKGLFKTGWNGTVWAVGRIRRAFGFQKPIRVVNEIVFFLTHLILGGIARFTVLCYLKKRVKS